jgi:hypothetical protein
MSNISIRILASAGLALATFSAPPAHAAFVVTFTEEGASILAEGSGSIDLNGLTRSPVLSTAAPQAEGGLGIEFSGPAPGDNTMTGYYGAVGPATFGPATGGGLADAGEGDVVGIVTSGNSSFVVIYLDPSYQSGAQLTTFSTFEGQTFASLGLTPGTYVYRWPSDSYTVQIGSLGSSLPGGATPVPEASTWIMMLMGFGGLGAGAVLRQRRARLSGV